MAEDGLRDKGLCKENFGASLAEVPAVQVVVTDEGDGAMAADFAVASPHFVLLVHVRPLCRVRLIRT
ncbi:hypothetical protein [Catenulispora rubra]|uniref:hypothetical protein n=1 Tax=Catenulispora rubra TaxID=280293 RepID=UPI0018924A75|nr:hypothetical protein [Catenulispora rubra]